MPIASLIAPATLGVDLAMDYTTKLTNVSTLAIEQPSAYVGFAYAPNGSSVDRPKFLGPRTIVQRLAVAAATTGEIVTLPVPDTNASYVQKFAAPYVQCAEPAAPIRSQIDGMIARAEAQLESVKSISTDYLAAVSALSNMPESSQTTVEVANLSTVDGALQAANQIWISAPRYVADRNFSGARTPYYLTCELYKSIYTVNFSWTNGRQTVRVLNNSVTNVVPYPANATREEDSKEAMAFSAVFWALSTQLTGYIGFQEDFSASNVTENADGFVNHIYSVINSEIAKTVLIGARDFDAHFLQNHGQEAPPGGTATFSGQRLKDMSYVANRSLAELIPELSSNITISLISDEILA